MKGAHGVEPWTYRSAVDCSTTELYTRSIQIFCFLLNTFYLLLLQSTLNTSKGDAPRKNRCSSINFWIRILMGKYNLEIIWIVIITCKGHLKVLTFMNTGDLLLNYVLRKCGLHMYFQRCANKYYKFSLTLSSICTKK